MIGHASLLQYILLDHIRLRAPHGKCGFLHPTYLTHLKHSLSTRIAQSMGIESERRIRVFSTKVWSMNIYEIIANAKH